MTTSFVKDSDAVLDFSWDWTTWLAASETIASYTIVVPTGITKASDSRTGAVVTAWLSGGTVGATYRLVCRVTTNQGRTDDRGITVRVLDR